MDFLDPNKKRKHIRRIYLGYILIGIGILLSAFILVYISYGYKLDSQTGNIVKNGLIFINSAPESASIYLNGKENGNTEKRLTVPEGQYYIELRRKGYTTWKKTIKLAGSSIERLVYPVLFPEKLEPKAIKYYSANPQFSTQSLDRKWIIISTPGSITNFEIYDTSKPQDPAKTFSVPANIYSPAIKPVTSDIKLVEWSSDNKNFLVKHSYDGKYEYILINRETPSTSVNLNNFFGIAPKEIALRDKKADQFYILQTDLSLSSATSKSKTLTPVLANVSSFKSHQKEIIIYATNDPATPEVTTLMIRDNNKNYKIKDFAKSPLLLDIVQFDDHWYAAATSTKEGGLYIYQDPVQKIDRKLKNALIPYNILKITKPVKLNFSANARFVMAQNKKGVAVYDFEDEDRYNYDFTKELPAGQFATWMDGHRILTTIDKTSEVFEFDNQNKRTLVPITSNSLPYFDRNYERLFTLAESTTTPKSVDLNKTILKIGLKD